RVRGPVDLREDVADARRFDDGPNRATGDDARALRCWLPQHGGRREHLAGLVRDRRPDHRDPDQVLLCVLDALSDRFRNLTGLAEPAADVASSVADAHDRAEAEAPAAFDDLRDAVDLDDALLECQLVGIDACHVGSLRFTLAGGLACALQKSRPASRAASA